MNFPTKTFITIFYFLLFFVQPSSVFCGSKTASEHQASIKHKAFSLKKVFLKGEINASKKNFEPSKIKYNSMVNLDFSPLQVTLATGINTTTFDEIKNWNPYDFYEFSKKNWGAEYSLNKSFLSINVLAGTLGFSQDISRLKNPAFSSGASALKGFSFLSPGINPSLPALSSSAKPVAAAFTIQESSKTIFMPVLQFAYTQEKDFYTSIYKKIPFKNMNLTVSSTAGLFNYHTDFLDSWYLSQKPIADKAYGAALHQLIFTSPLFKTSATLGTMQNPYGEYSFWTRLYSSINLAFFDFHFQGFFSDPLLITAEGKQLNTVQQTLFNPQIKIPILLSLFKAGYLFQQDYCLTDTTNHEPYTKTHHKAALELTIPQNSFFLTFSLVDSQIQDELPQNYKLQWNHFTKTLNSNFYISTGFKNDQRQYTISQTFKPLKNLLSSINIQTDFILKEFPSVTYTAGLNFLTHKNNFSMSLKINYTYTENFK